MSDVREVTPEIGTIKAGSNRRPLRSRRPAVAVEFEHAGHKYRVSFGRYPSGELAEIFLDALGRANTSTIQEHASTSAILVSLLLQHGVSVDVVRHSISGPIAVALDILARDR